MAKTETAAATSLKFRVFDIGELVDEHDTILAEFDPTDETVKAWEDRADLLDAAIDLVAAAKNARIILASFRASGDGGLNTIIADLDAAIAKAGPQ